MTETINRPPTTKKLYLITNDTHENATLTSLKHEGDTTRSHVFLWLIPGARMGTIA